MDPKTLYLVAGGLALADLGLDRPPHQVTDEIAETHDDEPRSPGLYARAAAVARRLSTGVRRRVALRPSVD